MSTTWDNGRGLLYVFPPFKLVPQVLQKIYQSHGVQMVLVAPKQETVSQFPELLELSQEDPILLYAEGPPLLTQDVILPDGETETHHYRPSNLHVDTLRAILRAKGSTWEAAYMMSRSLRQSSLQVYESHWGRIVHFCRRKRWQVFNVRSHHFSTYLMHLFRDGLLPSTIISHRTSVASVLCHWKYNPAADPHIKLLIRAFRLERPVQCRIVPKWDLHLVLSALMSPPFASEVDDRGRISD